MADDLCEDCPPEKYSNASTRCASCPRRKSGGIEIISQHSTQIGQVKVNFTVGRIGKRT